MKKSELQALINLLDDKDPLVFNAVRKKLSESDEAVSELKMLVSNSKNDLLTERAKEIIRQHHFKNQTKILSIG